MAFLSPNPYMNQPIQLGQPMYQPNMYQPYVPQPIPPVASQPQVGQAPTPQQAMSPPTIHAEIIQVDNEQAAKNYPLAVGMSQMMIAKDDSAIFVKSVYANEQMQFDVYVKRPPEPPEPKLNAGDYVTWDGLEERLSRLLAGMQTAPVTQSTPTTTYSRKTANSTTQERAEK